MAVKVRLWKMIRPWLFLSYVWFSKSMTLTNLASPNINIAFNNILITRLCFPVGLCCSCFSVSICQSKRSPSCCRWWSLSMLKAWRSATLSLWTRTALYELPSGTSTTTPSCQTPMTGPLSASAPRPSRNRRNPHCSPSHNVTFFLCLPFYSLSQIFWDVHSYVSAIEKRAVLLSCPWICTDSVL